MRNTSMVLQLWNCAVEHHNQLAISETNVKNHGEQIGAKFLRRADQE
jgi:hypothetical protein